jgi:hypothetical protein
MGEWWREGGEKRYGMNRERSILDVGKEIWKCIDGGDVLE